MDQFLITSNIVSVPLLCLIFKILYIIIKEEKRIASGTRTNRHIMLFSLFVLCGAHCCIHLNT